MEQPDHQLRILVADDDEAMRDTVALALVMEGYAPVPVGSPEALFGALQRNVWDLVILDTLGVRPDPAAFSFLERVTDQAGTPPTIVLTGSTATAQWAKATGKFAGVLEKPIDVDVLFRVVAGALDGEREA